MRHPLVLVIKDLWYFVTSEMRYWLPVSHSVPALSSPERPPLLSPSESSAPLFLLSSSTAVSQATDVQSPLSTVTEAVDFEVPPLDSEFVSHKPVIFFEPFDPVVMYVATKWAGCLITPRKDFDSVLTKFSYGTAVTVTGYQGEYAKVFWSHHEGWVRKDDITPNKSEVWPYLTSGTVYFATDEQVKKLRLLIGDTFNSSELSLPLQAGEWVVYRFREQNRNIPWPVTHGRISGDWQSLLKGVSGVHIGITPKTDSIMEWRGEDGIGRVAYVEKVAPDLTITISVVGFEVSGSFEERALLESEWREFRPVFIDIL